MKDLIKSLGVVIGRFQVPSLHDGHKHLINLAYAPNLELLILIGSANEQYTERNPLPYRIRKEMLQEFLPAAHILPLMDAKDDDIKWSSFIDRAILSLGSYDEVRLYHGRDSFARHYQGQYPLQEISSIAGISGTAIRESMTIINCVEYRQGIISACTRHKHRYFRREIGAVLTCTCGDVYPDEPGY